MSCYPWYRPANLKGLICSCSAYITNFCLCKCLCAGKRSQLIEPKFSHNDLLFSEGRSSGLVVAALDYVLAPSHRLDHDLNAFHLTTICSARSSHCGLSAHGLSFHLCHCLLLVSKSSSQQPRWRRSNRISSPVHYCGVSLGRSPHLQFYPLRWLPLLPAILRSDFRSRVHDRHLLDSVHLLWRSSSGRPSVRNADHFPDRLHGRGMDYRPYHSKEAYLASGGEVAPTFRPHVVSRQLPIASLPGDLTWSSHDTGRSSEDIIHLFTSCCSLGSPLSIGLLSSNLGVCSSAQDLGI